MMARNGSRGRFPVAIGPFRGAGEVSFLAERDLDLSFLRSGSWIWCACVREGFCCTLHVWSGLLRSRRSVLAALDRRTQLRPDHV